MAKKNESKRNGVFKTLGEIMKSDTKRELSVKKLANSVMSKHPGHEFGHYTKAILQIAAWCKRNDVKCVKLIHDHKPKAVKAEKPEPKAKAKKAAKDPLA